MGCCLPKALNFDAALKAEVLEKHDDARRALALTEDELWRLHHAFSDANKSESGTVSKEEYLSFLGAASGAFATRAFELYKDEPLGVTFRSWLFACWSICTRDADNLVNFAFQMYDVKGRGELGLADVNLLLSEIFGVGFEHSKDAMSIYKKLVRIDYKGTALDAHVTIEAFMPLAKGSPLLCYPAFKLQRRLQEKTLGATQWDVVTARRDKLIRENSFDVMAVVALANSMRTRSSSVVPLDPRHIVPIKAAMGPTKNIMDYLPGLRTSTKVAPEGNYAELDKRIDDAMRAEEEEEALREKAKEAAKASVAFAQELAAQAMKSPKDAARRASQVGAKAVHAAVRLAGGALVSAATNIGQSVQQAADSFNSDQPSSRRNSLTNAASASSSKSARRNEELAAMDTVATAGQDDPLAQARARKASIAENDNLYKKSAKKEKRASQAGPGDALPGAVPGQRHALSERAMEQDGPGAESKAAKMRRMSQTVATINTGEQGTAMSAAEKKRRESLLIAKAMRRASGVA